MVDGRSVIRVAMGKPSTVLGVDSPHGCFGVTHVPLIHPRVNCGGIYSDLLLRPEEEEGADAVSVFTGKGFSRQLETQQDEARPPPPSLWVCPLDFAQAILSHRGVIIAKESV